MECGGDIDLQDSRGATPLHAVYRSARSNGIFFKNLSPADSDTDKDCFPCSGGKRQDILQALLESHANPNIRDNGGDTPLMLVIKTKGAIFTRLGHMRLLLEYGANPDAPDNKGATPLIQAILSHSGYADYGVPEEIINTLLGFRADPDLRDSEGDTALIHAAKDDENTLAEIEALLAGGADPCLADRNGKLPYDHASEGSSVRNVLYKAGGNFDKELGMCARDAHAAMEQENELNISRDNRRRIQSCLMALGYNPGPADGIFGQRTQDAIRAWQKSQGYSASGYFGSGQAVELLEACEVTEPANQSETPQSDAGNVDLDALAEAMRNTGKYDNVHIQGVRNEDVNANDKNGYTSLHVAAANDHTRVVEMLIAAGADVHARTHDEYESTPLIVAAWGGRTRIVEVLIAAGANVNASNIYDATVLMGSALGGYTRTVEVLISAGANVYARNIFGHTSLHVATVNGHTRVVEVLIAAGADVNANDKKGYTPLKLAVYLDHDRIADILRAHGARF